MTTPSPPEQFRARVTNIAMTAHVQIAYACITTAQARTLDAARQIETWWPETPLREAVAAALRWQASGAGDLAQDVLNEARRRCGLAFTDPAAAYRQPQQAGRPAPN